MLSFRHSIFAAAFAALLVSGNSVSSDAIAAGRFDGDWSVVIYTMRGDCDRSLRYSVHIVDSRVLPGQANYQAAGRVTPSGNISVVVAEAGRTASGYGRLVGNNGRGVWRTSTGQCTGNWTAVRRSF